MAPSTKLKVLKIAVEDITGEEVEPDSDAQSLVKRLHADSRSLKGDIDYNKCCAKLNAYEAQNSSESVKPTGALPANKFQKRLFAAVSDVKPYRLCRSYHNMGRVLLEDEADKTGDQWQVPAILMNGDHRRMKPATGADAATHNEAVAKAIKAADGKVKGHHVESSRTSSVKDVAGDEGKEDVASDTKGASRPVPVLTAAAAKLNHIVEDEVRAGSGVHEVVKHDFRAQEASFLRIKQSSEALKIRLKESAEAHQKAKQLEEENAELRHEINELREVMAKIGGVTDAYWSHKRKRGE